VILSPKVEREGKLLKSVSPGSSMDRKMNKTGSMDELLQKAAKLRSLTIDHENSSKRKSILETQREMIAPKT
jgi:hypothetical protein